MRFNSNKVNSTKFLKKAGGRNRKDEKKKKQLYANLKHLLKIRAYTHEFEECAILCAYFFLRMLIAAGYFRKQNFFLLY